MTMDTFEVIRPGPLTTVQDGGRHGYQQYGVPPSGALDDYAFRIGNILVGNEENAAALEITLSGCRLRVLRETAVAVTGADLTPTLNGNLMRMYETVPVGSGDVLSFPRIKSGCRAYLAVAGGIDVPLVMGSAATYVRSGIGGIEGRALRSGDIIRTGEAAIARAGARIPPRFVPDYSSTAELRVILGPQDNYFTETAINTFLNSVYAVSPQADRMGYRLEGPRLQHKAGADIVSDGIPAGAVQVPGDGLPIVLLADRPTTGGYAKLATVLTADLSRLAQAKPGDRVRFSRVSEAAAVTALREYEQKMATVRRLLTGQ